MEQSRGLSLMHQEEVRAPYLAQTDESSQRICHPQRKELSMRVLNLMIWLKKRLFWTPAGIIVALIYFGWEQTQRSRNTFERLKPLMFIQQVFQV